jgi:abhydrolase domain-containing protein 6
VPHPTLVIWGENDRVLSDVPGAVRAADQILRVTQVVIPRCGHAPQIEKARLVNRLISRYLRGRLDTIPPDLAPGRYLRRHAERALRPAGSLAARSTP